MSFLPDIGAFLQFAVAAVILTFIPGPDMAFFMSRTLSYGRSAGLAGIAGCCTGIFVQVILVACGLSALIVASPTVFFVLKIMGALYLLWLAFQAVFDKSALNFNGERVKALPLKTHYWAGIGINLLNPKVILFNIAFLPQFVDVHDPHAAGKILFLGLSFIPISLPFTICMVLVADWFANTLNHNPKIIRALNWLLAALFTTFAISVLMTKPI